MQYLKKKLIVITGASSGVGKAMAVEFAGQGARLMLAARRLSALQEVAAECRELGAEVEVCVTDIRSAQEVQLLAKAAFEFGGSIDVWVNNAGVLAAGALDEMPALVTEHVIQTNLLGYMYGAKEAIPYFKQQGHGILINNISVGGWLPTPYAAAYSASKFGVRGFSEALKAELNSYPKIHVIDLYPGFLDTPGIHHAANYTGKVLRPAPPVYDPRKVARAVARLIAFPRKRKTIGAASAFLQLAYGLFPTFTRNITGVVIRRYLKQAKPAEPTSGNILNPVDFGTSIDGGARLHPRPSRLAVALLAGVALGGLYLGNRLSHRYR